MRMPRVRLSITPRSHDVSETKVFISYRTVDWDYANSISKGLSGLGFQTVVLPPVSSQKLMTEEDSQNLIHPGAQTKEIVLEVA